MRSSLALRGHEVLTVGPNQASTSALRVEIISPGGERAWDDYVNASPYGTFFHLAGWKHVIERAFGHATFYLAARQGDTVVGVLPLTHIKSRLFGNALIANAFCVYGGPLANDDTVRQALDGEAGRIMGRIGARYLEYRSIQPAHDDWPRRGDLYVTFRRPIFPDVESNLKAIPRKQRAMVRKGIQFGLRSEIDDDVERLHHIYAQSVLNLGTPVFPKKYFSILKEEFKSACDIVTVVCGKVAIASVLNLYFKDQVLPYYGGGTTAARAWAANDFMYWEVMRRACERGYCLFDFGRSKVGTGAYDFKRYWGFEPTPLVYEYQLANGERIPDVNPLSPKYRTFVRVWKLLPLPVSKLLGPMIVRNIG